jgi:hypothetical protein
VSPPPRCFVPSWYHRPLALDHEFGVPVQSSAPSMKTKKLSPTQRIPYYQRPKSAS